MGLTACLVYSQHFKSASFQVVFRNSWNTLWDTSQDKRPGQCMASNQQSIYVSLTHAYTHIHTLTHTDWELDSPRVCCSAGWHVLYKHMSWQNYALHLLWIPSEVWTQSQEKPRKTSSLITQDMSPRDPIIDHVGSWFGKLHVSGPSPQCEPGNEDER